MDYQYERTKQLLRDWAAASAGSSNDSSADPAVLLPREQALYLRLQSFSPITWFGKPPGLSALQCATKGWRNTGPDTLTCDACGCKILCALPANISNDPGASIARSFEGQLAQAHGAACPYRSSAATTAQQAVSLRFPLVPGCRLASNFRQHLQQLQQLELTPPVQTAVLIQLAAEAWKLDPMLLRPLALLTQLSEAALRQPSLPALGQSSNQAGLAEQQAQALLALCGWQVHQMVPPQLAAAAAAVAGKRQFAVAHLVPPSSTSSTAAPAGAGSSAGRDGPAAAAAGSPPLIGCVQSVLRCELCGSKVGMWQFSCSGPHYAQQLASKAAGLRSAADAIQLDLAASGAASPAGALGLSSDTAPPSTQEQLQQHREASDELVKQQQQQQQPPCDDGSQHHPAAVSPPSASVAATLTATIAGGALLAAPSAAAAAAAGSAGGRSSPAAGFSSGFARKSSGGLFLTPSPRSTGPFGAPALPAFGTGSSSSPGLGLVRPAGTAGTPGVGVGGQSSGGGGGLFGLLGGAGPEGGVVNPTADSGEASLAAVFGLEALKDEEQRVKRRRSSSCAAATAGVAGTATLLQQRQQGHEDVAAGNGSAIGSTTSSLPQRCSPTAALATRDKGEAGSSVTYFDPVAQHRAWCPWVNSPAEVGSSGTAAAPSTGPAAVLAMGWSSTLMALLEELEDQQLVAPAAGQSPVADQHTQLTTPPVPDQFDSTLTVLAKARQLINTLE